MMKWIIGIVVIVLAAAVLWWSGWLGTMIPQAPTQTATTTSETTQQAQAPTNGMSASADTSDTAIQQDAAAVDAQIQGLTQDSTNFDSSLNDKSVQ